MYPLRGPLLSSYSLTILDRYYKRGLVCIYIGKSLLSCSFILGVKSTTDISLGFNISNDLILFLSLSYLISLFISNVSFSYNFLFFIIFRIVRAYIASSLLSLILYKSDTLSYGKYFILSLYIFLSLSSNTSSYNIYMLLVSSLFNKN
jgi:hypothetical protein